MTTRNRWIALRAVLMLSGINLLGYIVYRYMLVPPPNHGSVYGIIFAFSLVLVAAGIALALEPYLLAGDGRGRLAVRGALTAFGGVWMTTGVLCARSLAAGVTKRPLGGSLDMLHMVSDHVVLPLGVAALAWAPGRIAAWVGVRGDEVAMPRSASLSPDPPGDVPGAPRRAPTPN